MKKHIIITGASRGIGFETAAYLLNRNCIVTAIARSEENLSRLRAGHQTDVWPLAMDITQKESLETLKGHLKEKDLKIDGLIHNAGLLINKPFDELTEQDWQRQIEVNLSAPVRLTKHLLNFFAKGSHILNIGSMGGFQGSSKFPGLSAYSASKGALAVLSECLAAELAGRSISCNCLCPGAVQTEMFGQAFPGFQAPVNPDEMGTFIGDFILKGHRFFNGKILPVSLNDPA